MRTKFECDLETRWKKRTLPTTASITKNSIACKFRDEQFNEGRKWDFQAQAKANTVNLFIEKNGVQRRFVNLKIL